MSQVFHPSPHPTLGVEWEIALIDPATCDLVPRAGEVIDLVVKHNPDIHLEREFLANTIEIVTPVCHTVPEAIKYIDRATTALTHAATQLDLRLWSSGSHPFSDFRSQPVSDKGSYAEIIERTQYWGNQMLIWGIHVHVGISERERVWPIINAMLTMYPHILALGASSPGWDGIDTGYASNRTMLYQQLPTAGLPYQFANWQQWESYMKDQDKSGVINHTGSMHFDIRPAGKWGTIEVRISDATSNIRELSAIVALTHCLIVYFDRMIDRGEELPTLQDWHIAENKWRAARYGLDALIITSRDTDECPVTQDLAHWITRLDDIAQELDCAPELALIHEIIARGAGYQRQRTLFERTQSWADVVAATSAELDTLRPIR
ncbi:glutamate--cysteine ligase [Corynebacterium sp. sy017]|uniref:glutamate--cysteine ligase n=1 Tax=unclassified Corynebacterium TaxID=2624378 RepID=UPI00118562EB|nr:MULTISPECIES: glutamate--cysteine ligase [unclassified Corynebacterium]MBP3088452.1 glutamate--cysteine ligase [Corynebacterium sp. sy017]QDZ41887.1 glutamate--cysteine ligase [Corynebacterium sp. sy039]TSD91761.1 glutamate--cysteine ligase [Corynebacterium sp. SY003]